MSRSRSALTILLSISLAAAWNVPAEARGDKYDWVLKKDQDGVQIHVRKVKGSDYLRFNGLVVLNIGLDELLRLYEEREDGRMPEWFYGCKSVRLVETRSPDEKIFYMVFSMPKPLRDRDIVYRRTRAVDPVSGIVEYRINSLNDFLPKASHKVRMPSIEVYWRLEPTPDGKTQIYYEQHSEVGGLLPAWLVNAMSVEVPFKTLTGLRRLTDTGAGSGKVGRGAAPAKRETPQAD